MFFILSKTAAFLVLPSNFLFVLGLAGLALTTTRWRRVGARLAVASFILLAVIGFLPLGELLTHVLENRFPPWDPARGTPDGIVILGADISVEFSRDHTAPEFEGSAARIVAMVKLARTYPDARIVYSGGDPSLFGNQLPEADFVNPLLDIFGIAHERVLLETRSRNTAENAGLTKAMVKPKPGERWLLVTSAQHMPRAIGCSRRVGFPVEAYPVGWRTGAEASVMPQRKLSSGLTRFDIAAHEWTALLVYWLTAKTTEFLPAP